MYHFKDFPECLKIKHIPIETKRRSGIKMDKVKFIVLHDTGNKNTSATQNVDYYIDSSDSISASAHIFVDDKDIIECIPLDEKAWHVMYEKPLDNSMYGDDANDVAIGIELCYFKGIIRSKKAYMNYINTVAYLCYAYELNPLSQLIGHFELDSERRTDPINALSNIDITWDDMIEHINDIYMRILEKDEIIENDGILFHKELDEGDLNNNSIIRYGLNLYTIKNIQHMLLKLDILSDNHQADGNYDIYTKHAISLFQKRHGLIIDGICGKQTLPILIEEYNKLGKK